MRIVGFLLIVAAAGCDSNVSTTGTVAAASAATEPTTTMTGLRPHQGANCPTSLQGTTTTIAMTAGGVDVTVASNDLVVVRKIVSLSAFRARGVTAEVSYPHDKKHGGSGRGGYCPIIVNERTRVTMTPGPGGVTLHVNARSPGYVSELQQLIRARVARLPSYHSS